MYVPDPAACASALHRAPTPSAPAAAAPARASDLRVTARCSSGCPITFRGNVSPSFAPPFLALGTVGVATLPRRFVCIQEETRNQKFVGRDLAQLPGEPRSQCLDRSWIDVVARGHRDPNVVAQTP